MPPIYGLRQIVLVLAINLATLPAALQTKSGNVGADGQSFMPVSLIGTQVHPVYPVCNFLSVPRFTGSSDEYTGITVLEPNGQAVSHCITSFGFPRGNDWRYFPSESQFTVTKIEYHEDLRRGRYVELTLAPYLQVTPQLSDANGLATVELMLPQNWQESMNKSDILRLITLYFPNVGHKARSLDKVDPLAHRPKLGRPSYTETGSWLRLKIPELGTPFKENERGWRTNAGVQYKLISMDSCVLVFEATVTDSENWDGTGPHVTRSTVTTVPLADITAVETGVAILNKYGVQVGRDEKELVLDTRHFDKVILSRKDDYDTNQLARRIVDALKHAVALCEVSPAKSNEPF